jgi:polar amino acid transport system substrate-binding protein
MLHSETRTYSRVREVGARLRRDFLLGTIASAAPAKRQMISRTLLWFAASVTLASAAISTEAAAGTLTDYTHSPTVQRIKERGAFRGGVAITAPAAFKNPATGELMGIAIEVGKAAATKLGVRLETSETGWDTIIAGLQAEKYDVTLTSLFETPKRKEVVDFVTFGTEGIAFLVRKDNGDIRTAEDMHRPGVSIATLTGSGSEQMIRENFKSAEIRSIISPTGGSGAPPEEVISGRVDAAQFDAVLTHAYLERFPNLKVVPEDAFEHPLFPTPIGVAVRKDDPLFREFLADVVEELQSSGRMAKWREKWTKPDVLLSH